jgi:hypothetical protein
VSPHSYPFCLLDGSTCGTSWVKPLKLTKLCCQLSTTAPCTHPPQRSEHAHNPNGLSYANADTIDEVKVEPRRPSKRGSRYATASAEARERRAPSFRETKEWEFRSTVRDREQDSTSEEVPSGVRRRSSKAPKPVLTEDVPLISLDDEYHQAMDMGDELPRRNKPRRASDSRSSRDEPHSSIEEEMEQDANQRGWFSPENPRSRTPDATNPKKAPAAKPKQVVPAPAPAPAPIPPVVRPTDYYDVSVRQVSQAVLPPTPNVLTGCPATFAPTQVYAYGPRNIANQPFHLWPGFTIEAQVREGMCPYMLHTACIVQQQLLDALMLWWLQAWDSATTCSSSSCVPALM